MKHTLIIAMMVLGINQAFAQEKIHATEYSGDAILHYTQDLTIPTGAGRTKPKMNDLEGTFIMKVSNSQTLMTMDSKDIGFMAKITDTYTNDLGGVGYVVKADTWDMGLLVEITTLSGGNQAVEFIWQGDAGAKTQIWGYSIHDISIGGIYLTEVN